MTAELAQSTGALGGNGGVVIDIGERVLPSLIGVLLALPQVPREVGVHEDASLGRLGLLHRVEHDALNLTRLNVGAQSILVAAHGQRVLAVVGARPVDPHKGSNARVPRKGRGKVVVDLAPHATTGIDDLDGLGQVGIPRLAPAHVVHGAEDERVFETRVLKRTVGVLLGLLLVQPVGHILAKPGVQSAALVAGVIGKNGNLADAMIHNLRELLLEDSYGRVVVGARDGVVHKRMKREHKAALGGIAGLGQGLDLLGQLLLGIELTPLGIVLGVILGSIDISVELVVAAPLHKVHTVLGTPRIAVVALDKTARHHVSIVGHGKAAQLGIGSLLQDLIERGQAVVGSVGGLAQHNNAVGLVALRRQRGQYIGIGLVKQAFRIGQLAALDELIDIGVDRAARALYTHEHRSHVALGRNGINVRGVDALQCQGLIQTALGVGIDARLREHACLGAQGLRALAVHHAMGRGIQLIVSRCLLGIGLQRNQAAQAGKHNRCDSEQLGYHPFLHLLNPFLRQIFIRLRAIDDGS